MVLYKLLQVIIFKQTSIKEDKHQLIGENLHYWKDNSSPPEQADFLAGHGCFQIKLFCDTLKTELEISLIPHRDTD